MSVQDVDGTVALGYLQTNSGCYEHATTIFSNILSQCPTHEAALLGRGSALALQRHFPEAEHDFSLAISGNPQGGDAWKRRGQVAQWFKIVLIRKASSGQSSATAYCGSYLRPEDGSKPAAN